MREIMEKLALKRMGVNVGDALTRALGGGETP